MFAADAAGSWGRVGEEMPAILPKSHKLGMAIAQLINLAIVKFRSLPIRLPSSGNAIAL
jgi:hypothetical protein